MKEPGFVLFLIFAIPVSVFDATRFRIPDYLSLPGLGLAFLLSFLGVGPVLIDAVSGAFAGLALFLAARWLTRGRLGLGDVKYSATVGAFVGLFGWSVAILAGSVLGILFYLVMHRFAGYTRDCRIPFAPFMSAGAVLSFLLPQGMVLI